DVVAERFAAMQELGQMMEVPGQRVRHRLRLVVVVETGQVAPAAVATELDQTRAELDAEEQPAEQDEQWQRGRSRRVPQEDRKKSGLEEQRLPAEPVEGLAHIHERQVQRPQRQPEEQRQRQRPGLRQSAYGDRRERDPDPGRDLRELVGVAQLEQARRTSERDGGNEPRDWKQAMLAEERNELACGDDECNEIHRA